MRVPHAYLLQRHLRQLSIESGPLEGLYAVLLFCDIWNINKCFVLVNDIIHARITSLVSVIPEDAFYVILPGVTATQANIHIL